MKELKSKVIFSNFEFESVCQISTDYQDDPVVIEIANSRLATETLSKLIYQIVDWGDLSDETIKDTIKNFLLHFSFNGKRFAKIQNEIKKYELKH